MIKETLLAITILASVSVSQAMTTICEDKLLDRLQHLNGQLNLRTSGGESHYSTSIRRLIKAILIVEEKLELEKEAKKNPHRGLRFKRDGGCV